MMMTFHNTFALIIAIAVVSLVALIWLRDMMSWPVFVRNLQGGQPNDGTTNTRTLREFDTAKEVLKQPTLRSRALPNQRLVFVFKIDNAFTTSDEAYHKQFVEKAKRLLKTSGEEWKIIGEDANANANRYIKDSDKDDINLVCFVQTIVLCSVLGKLFPNLPGPGFGDVAIIAEALNYLWVLSKSCSEHGSKQHLSDWCQLQRALNRIFGRPAHYSIEGENSELNLILPAYETLWRVVLRCFIEARFRSSPIESMTWRELLRRFLKRPTKLTFHCKPVEQPELSVDFLVRETLRLYPPTRRIYRNMERDGMVDAVDVECLHRDANIWGEDSMAFRPARWGRLLEFRSEGPQSYIPFGWGRFECPARRTFGPMMIGLLVAALDGAVGNEYILKSGSMEDSIERFQTLQGGREAYKTLRLTVA